MLFLFRNFPKEKESIEKLFNFPIDAHCVKLRIIFSHGSAPLPLISKRQEGTAAKSIYVQNL